MVEVFLILTMMVLLPIIIKIGVILFVEAAPMVEGIQAIMEDVEDRAEVVVVLWIKLSHNVNYMESLVLLYYNACIGGFFL